MGKYEKAIAAARRGEYENAEQLQQLFGGKIDVNAVLAESLELMAALDDENTGSGELD